MTDCNVWKTEKRHECTNMGKVERLVLWWQLHVTWLPVRDLETSGRLILLNRGYIIYVNQTLGSALTVLSLRLHGEEKHVYWSVHWNCGGQNDIGNCFSLRASTSCVGFIPRKLYIISWSFCTLATIWECGIYSSCFVGENKVFFLRPELA